MDGKTIPTSTTTTPDAIESSALLLSSRPSSWEFIDTILGQLTSYTRKGLSELAHNVHMMSSDKKRVQFRAPHRLIDRTDALADVLGEDRTDILVTALREYLQEAAHDDALTQEIAAAYYDDEISFEQLKALVGAEEAANLRVLKQQLENDFIDGVVDA